MIWDSQLLALFLPAVSSFSTFGCKELIRFQYWPPGDVHAYSLLLYCWKRVFALSEFSWQNSISLCPVSCCTPKPNLSVTPGVSWFPTFAFQGRNSLQGLKKKWQQLVTWSHQKKWGTPKIINMWVNIKDSIYVFLLIYSPTSLKDVNILKVINLTVHFGVIYIKIYLCF